MEINSVMNISAKQCVPKRMTKEETNIVIDTLFQFTKRLIGYLVLIETLRGRQSTNHLEFQRNWDLSSQGSETQLQFVIGILCKLSFEEIINILGQADFKAFAFVLKQRKLNGIIYRVAKRRISNTGITLHYTRPTVQIKYRCDAEEMLQTRISKLRRNLHDTTESKSKKQRDANIIVSMYISLSKMCRDHETFRATLEKMKLTIPNDLDRTLVESTYYSRMATKEIMTGDFDTAMDYAIMAEKECPLDLAELSFASSVVAFDNLYVFKESYARTQRLQDLKEVLRLGDIAITAVPTDRTELEEGWKISVFLYQAMSLLNIANRFDVKDTAPHSDLYLEKIRNILTGVTHCFTLVDSDLRTLVAYSVCMARYKELTGDFEAARIYQQEAMTFVKKGAVCFDEERENMKNYGVKLQQTYKGGILIYTRAK